MQGTGPDSEGVILGTPKPHQNSGIVAEGKLSLWKLRQGLNFRAGRLWDESV